MAELAPEASLTEPEIITCNFVTGWAVESSQHHVRLIAWSDLPHLGGEMDERRIVIRCGMPIDTARRLLRDLKKSINGRS